jgi:hypothetical protein
MGSFKGDIQATRFAATTTNAIVAAPVRLRGIIIAAISDVRYGYFKNY